jgi:hypothetical protein
MLSALDLGCRIEAGDLAPPPVIDLGLAGDLLALPLPSSCAASPRPFDLSSAVFTPFARAWQEVGIAP